LDVIIELLLAFSLPRQILQAKRFRLFANFFPPRSIEFNIRTRPIQTHNSMFIVWTGEIVRKTVISLLINIFLFSGAGVAFADNSAMFLVNTLPPQAEAGKKTVFLIRINNIATETWVGGEYSIFIRIFDENKEYLTETNRIRQFKDINPGEILKANITFDIPAEYSGIYYYRAGMDFEKEALFSQYFALRISPLIPTPETKKWTGNVEIDYQDDQLIESTTKLNLNLVNLVSSSSYLSLSVSGLASPVINPELNNFLISYHSKKLDLSAGDFTTSLSRLTLNRSRGVKAETKLGRVALAGLVASSQKEFKDDLYGLRGSVRLANNFQIATNYVQEKKNENSVASIEAEIGSGAGLTLRGEYAVNGHKGEFEWEPKKGNAFRVSTSFCCESLTLDASYDKVKPEFCFLGSPQQSGAYEQYQLSLTHSLTNYINGTMYYNKYHRPLSQNGDSIVTNMLGVDLTTTFPGLPSLLVSYSLDETNISDSVTSSINDVNKNLTIGFSYPIGKAIISANYLRLGYEDKSETAIHETTLSTSYSVSMPWGRRTNVSANYATCSAENSTDINMPRYQSISLGIRYSPSLLRLVLSPQYEITLPDSREEMKATASFAVNYSFMNRSVIRFSYSMTNYGELINPDKAISDRFSVNLSCQPSLGKTHKLELDYIFNVQRNFTAVESSTPTENSSLRLIYKLQI